MAENGEQNTAASKEVASGPDFSQLYSKCFNGEEPSITVIGGGNMATALVQGFIKTGSFDKSQVFICTKSAGTAHRWHQQGFPSAFPQSEFYQQVKKPRGIILIAVKPQVFSTFLAGVRANGWFSNGGPGLLCVSIMAGISLEQFDHELKSVGFTGHAARWMPNVNCAVAACTMLLTVGEQTPPEMIQLLHALGSSVGTVVQIEESQMNAAAAIAGCAPAFIAIVMEAISDGGVLSGLGRDLATRLTADMVKGTAQLALTGLDNHSSVQIKDVVCSPAGSTIAGVRQLEKKGVRSAFIEAVFASAKRASKLAFSSD